MSKGLEFDGDPDTTETSRFCHMFNKFFDCLNVRSMDECVLKQKPDMRPCKYKDDNRLEVHI